MLDELLLSGGLGLALVLLGLFAGFADRRNFHPGWLAVAAALVVINDGAVTRAFWLIPSISAIDGSWNWSGKALALLVTLAIAALPAFGWRQAGITLKQEQLRGALIVSAILLVVYAVMAWFMGAGGADAETIAYQLTMPGLEEEIFWRGLLLLVLNRAFAGHVRIGGAPIGLSLPVNAIMFGLIHGLSVKHGVWSFDAMAFALPCIGAIPAVWLREKTGSVVLPIALHNVVNLMFVLLPV